MPVKSGLSDTDENIRDLPAVIDEIAADPLDETCPAALRANNPTNLPLVGGNPRISPHVDQLSKFICIGLNYAEHAAESGVIT